ncbi:hypothetical protein N9O21_01900 [Rhodobacteraceae bacterium]|nr:hypothetical protein [Paracoccaceae bacterium]
MEKLERPASMYRFREGKTAKERMFDKIETEVRYLLRNDLPRQEQR